MKNMNKPNLNFFNCKTIAKTLMKIEIILVLCLILVGCSKNTSQDNADSSESSDEKIAISGSKEYFDSMKSFFETVNGLNNSINNIDSNNEASTNEFLGYMDELDKAFSTLPEMDIPQNVDGLSDLSEKASENMNKAVLYFHYAYDEEYSKYNEDTAKEYYLLANENLQYIIRIIHGEKYQDILSSELNLNQNDGSWESQEHDENWQEDDYSMFLEEDDNDYTVFNEAPTAEDSTEETNSNS